MPRGNRHRLAGYVWHITERCHRKQFLPKFARDRRNWIRWLYEARKRFGLCVLNYQVTSNHVHLLVRDRGAREIESSMQLIASCTGQAYNRRKHRRGAFWEDCYHATAVDTEEYLVRCLVYIDVNMVRAGVVRHPREWRESGYHEIQVRPSDTGSSTAMPFARRSGWEASAWRRCKTSGSIRAWQPAISSGRKSGARRWRSAGGASSNRYRKSSARAPDIDASRRLTASRSCGTARSLIRPVSGVKSQR